MWAVYTDTQSDQLQIAQAKNCGCVAADIPKSIWCATTIICGGNNRLEQNWTLSQKHSNQNRGGDGAYFRCGTKKRHPPIRTVKWPAISAIRGLRPLSQREGFPAISGDSTLRKRSEVSDKSVVRTVCVQWGENLGRNLAFPPHKARRIVHNYLNLLIKNHLGTCVAKLNARQSREPLRGDLLLQQPRSPMRWQWNTFLKQSDWPLWPCPALPLPKPRPWKIFLMRLASPLVDMLMLLIPTAPLIQMINQTIIIIIVHIHICIKVL